jgi:hypothetical protein
MALAAPMSLAIAEDAVQSPAAASETSAPQPSSSTVESSSSEGAMEATRTSVREFVLALARRIDSWFGPVPFEEGGGRVTDGQINFELYYNEDGKFNPNLRFKANLRLPNMERRTYAFIGRDNPSDVVADRPDDLTRQNKALSDQPGDKQLFAGLGRPVGKNFDMRLGVRGGLKPFAQARFWHQWLLSPVQVLDFRQTTFADPDAKLGSTTALSYAMALRPTLALRWLSSTTVTQQDPHFNWASNIGLYKDFGAQRQATMEVQMYGTIRGDVPITDYGLQGTWEQPVYRDWLLGQILVGRFWPRKDVTDVRQGRWVGGLYLKMRF